MGHNRQKTVVLVNFPKKQPFQAKELFGFNLAKNHSTFYLMICRRYFLETLQDDEAQQIDKGNIGHFYPEILFQYNCGIWDQFGPKICNLMSQAIMFHDLLSKKLILKCSMMGYHSQTKVILVSLPKRFPFRARTIWA